MDARSLYASPFPFDASLDALSDFFRAAAPGLKSVRMRRWMASKDFKGSVFAEFSSVEEADAVRLAVVGQLLRLLWLLGGCWRGLCAAQVWAACCGGRWLQLRRRRAAHDPPPPSPLPSPPAHPPHLPGARHGSRV